MKGCKAINQYCGRISMERFILCLVIVACVTQLVFAQVEEVPAKKSEWMEKSPTQSRIETETLESPQDTMPVDRKDLPKQEAERMRHFVTINFMIIIVVILMIALAIFLIANRIRRSKRQ
jgi:hypothetical protein